MPCCAIAHQLQEPVTERSRAGAHKSGTRNQSASDVRLRSRCTPPAGIERPPQAPACYRDRPQVVARSSPSPGWAAVILVWGWSARESRGVAVCAGAGGDSGRGHRGVSVATATIAFRTVQSLELFAIVTNGAVDVGSYRVTVYRRFLFFCSSSCRSALSPTFGRGPTGPPPPPPVPGSRPSCLDRVALSCPVVDRSPSHETCTLSGALTLPVRR